MLRCFFVGAVARVKRPGAKVDTALVLKSATQGTHKTSFFPTLTEAIPGAFLEGQEDFQSKDGLLAMHTGFIVELGEIDRITRKKDAEQVKNFLSKREDLIRMPYGRRVIPMPRSFLVVGTTNHSGFLVDTTGHRRFHIMETGSKKFNLDLLRGMVPQIWAQALAEYAAGMQWWLTPEMDTFHQDEMKAFEVEEPWEVLVLTALDQIKKQRHESKPKQLLAGGGHHCRGSSCDGCQTRKPASRPGPAGGGDPQEP